MYSLLIADDEIWVRKRLVQTIDWRKIGICQVFEAANGEEALKICLNHEPDIIVSDINMPLLDGIDLMKSLNTSGLCPQVIMISGYEKFEYAQAALKCGAIDYLLKPVDETELIASINKCITTLENQFRTNELINNSVTVTKSLTNRILIELISGKLEPGSIDSNMLKKLGIEFSANNAIVSSVVLFDETEYFDETNLDHTLLLHQLYEKLKEKLYPLFPGSYTLYSDDKLICIVFSNEKEEVFTRKLRKIFSDIHKDFFKSYGIKPAYSLGSVVHNLSGLYNSYIKTLVIPSTSCADEFNCENNDLDSLAYNYLGIYNDYDFSLLISKVRSGDYRNAKECLEGIVSDFLSNINDSISVFKIKLFYLRLLDELFSSCLSQLSVKDSSVNLYIDAIESINKVSTPHSMLESTCKILEPITEQYANRIGKHKHRLIDKIIQYVHANYSDPITMKDVANAFFLNPSYFSKLFKEETGKTFTSYLLDYRISKAKKLMLETNMKLYDISSAVGYSNFQYFSTVFKEREGIAPSQFREKYNIGCTE